MAKMVIKVKMVHEQHLRRLPVYRYKPVPEDQIVRAFQVLDVEGKGYLLPEELSKYMTEEGEEMQISFFHLQ